MKSSFSPQERAQWIKTQCRVHCGHMHITFLAPFAIEQIAYTLYGKLLLPFFAIAVRFC